MTRVRGKSRRVATLLAVCVCFGMWIFSTSVAAQEAASPIALETALDRYQATLGDVVTYSVIVRHEPSIEPAAPEFPTLEGLENLETGERVSEADDSPRKKTEFWIQYRVDAIGKILFPQIEVPFTVRQNGSETSGKAMTSQVELDVQSILRLQGEPTDIRDIKPVITTGRDWLAIVVPLLVGALLLAFVYYVWRRSIERRIASAKADSVRLPAHEQALKDLQALRSKGLLEAGRVREHHFALSEIFRRYLEERFEFPALDWTTEEIVAFMRRAAFVETPVQEAIDAVLRKTDRVKFARSLQAVPGDVLEDCIRLVRATAPRMQPAATREATP